MMSILINNKSTVFYNSRRLKYQKKILRLFNINEKVSSRKKNKHKPRFQFAYISDAENVEI